MNKISPPHHRLNNNTGFTIFSSTPNTITSFGTNNEYQFKWSAKKEEAAWYQAYEISISVDGGQTWTTGESVWSVYTELRRSSNEFGFGYHDNNSTLHKIIIEARKNHNKERRKNLDRARREAFKALSPEDKIRVKQEQTKAWKLRKEHAEERKAEKIKRIVNQIFEIGPELTRLKENIDEVLNVMSKGNIDRAFPYYYSRRRYINMAKWAVSDMYRHINAAHKRTAKHNK